MRIASYRRRDRAGHPREVGLVTEDGLSVRPLDLAALDAQRGALGLIEAHARGVPLPQAHGATIALADVILEAPLPEAGRHLFCRGPHVHWDGQGFCLYYKILQQGTFPWPGSGDAVARLTSAQLAMLWEGIDWRRPDWGAPPARVG